MKKENDDEFAGIVKASRSTGDSGGAEIKGGAEDTLGLDVYLAGAEEIQDDDFFGSLEIWDEEVDGKRDVVCESLDKGIERIMRASRHYMQCHLETELKLKLRNNNDLTLTRKARKFSQIAKILMQATWLEINDHYECWETDTTAIRLRNGKIVVISFEDNGMEDMLEKFKKFMKSRGGGMSGGFFGGDLDDLKRMMDGMDD